MQWRVPAKGRGRLVGGKFYTATGTQLEVKGYRHAEILLDVYGPRRAVEQVRQAKA